MASYLDRFNELREKGDFLEAARFAIFVAEQKGSKSGAWSWADWAKEASAKAGVEINFGSAGWPDFTLAKAALAK